MTVALTSIVAFKAFAAPGASLKETILGIVESYGADGCIMDDLHRHSASDIKQNSTISGLITPMDKEGLIFRAGDTRTGKSGLQQLVMRHMDFAHLFGFTPAAKTDKPYVRGMKDAARLLQAADPTFKTSPLFAVLLAAIKKA